MVYGVYNLEMYILFIDIDIDIYIYIYTFFFFQIINQIWFIFLSISLYTNHGVVN